MDNFTYSIPTTVHFGKGQIAQLRNALEAHYQVKSITHVGNFVFRADREDAAPLRITTEPVDLAMRTIRIIDIQETD